MKRKQLMKFTASSVKHSGDNVMNLPLLAAGLAGCLCVFCVRDAQWVWLSY